MPFSIRPHRRFPVQCSPLTTLGHSKAKARSGISPVPAGDSLVICPCDQEILSLTVLLPNEQHIKVSEAVVRWSRARSLRWRMSCPVTRSSVAAYVSNDWCRNQRRLTCGNKRTMSADSPSLLCCQSGVLPLPRGPILKLAWVPISSNYATALSEWPLAEGQCPGPAPPVCCTPMEGVPQGYESQPVVQESRRSGYAMAQASFGLLYANGDGVRGLYSRQWRKAAEKGNAQAQLHLGLLYANGEGVPQDYTKASQWYRKAAVQGYAMAQANLGNLYADGKGVPKDEIKGAVWIRKAAEQRDPNGQVSLGDMYRDGRGVPQDYIQALRWYNLGAANGAQRGAALRDALAKQMTPDQIAEAQKLAQEWKPKAP